MRPRDSQRQKLYNAERAIPEGKRFASTAECQAYVDTLLKERWFQSRWGQQRIKVQIKPYGHATADQSRNQINIPVWARYERVLIHEIAHLLCPRQFAGHGPEYAAIYLCLVKYQFGDEVAATLRESFTKHRVKYREGVRLLPEPKPQRVVTKQKVAERKKEAAQRPMSYTEKCQTARTLRLAVKQGLLGAPGTKQRQYALAIARVFEDLST